MAATVISNHGFTVAVTVADVNRAECDSKKCLRKITVLSHASVKLGKSGYCHFTGFRAQSAPPETPVTGYLKMKRKFLKKKKK